ncbi:unnamed protein product [Cochlearia groenlandica]
MVVNNSFDQWQKDIFFSAAEEVQKSTDIMDSAYRLWIREDKNKDEICNELQASLSTAKWQLDEFEKAVIASHKRCADDSASTRHKQFITAIENSINRVETSLQETYIKNGKKPLRWVNLNEKERDDLAMFLSGSSHSEKSIAEIARGNGNNSFECVVDIKENVKPGNARRTPNFDSLRIIVPCDGNVEEKEKMVSQVEATPKPKGTKPASWMERLTNCNHVFDRRGCCLQNPTRLPFNHPIKLTVSLMLMVFLLLPFLVYSY